MKKYGLLGRKLGHSYSKIIHEKLFRLKNIEASYELIEIEPDELKSMLDKVRTKEYEGFNVTIPYKQTILPYLDEISPIAREIGSVNTVFLKDGHLYGTNTDYDGFDAELKKYNISVQNKVCYILGTGGASHAVAKSLKDQGGIVKLVSRIKKDNALTYEELKISSSDWIINTTPLGMWPNTLESPLKKEVASKSEGIIDIIFNPKITLLMSYNKNSYNGLVMLLYQALKAQDLWMGIFKIDEIEFLKELEKEVYNE